MTDFPPPADDSGDIDEILSAYVDGEASPDEVALVEADPALMTRVDALRSLSLAVPAAPVAVRERHLAAALDLFDEQQQSRPATTASTDHVDKASTTAASTAGTVASLEAARERKRPRRLSLVTGIAAALALVFAGIVAFGFTNSTGDEVVSADVAVSESTGAIESQAQDASAPQAESQPAAADAIAADGDAMDDAAMSDDDTEEAMEEEAMDDAAMDDDEAEEAMEEEAMDDDEAMSAFAADEGVVAAAPFGSVLLRQPDAEARFADSTFTPLEAFTAQPLFVGEFAEPSLAMEIFTTSVHAAESVSDIEQAQRDAFAPLDCSDRLRGVTDLDGSSLVATAIIDGEATEFHRTANRVVLVVNHQLCVIESEFVTP